MKCLLYPLKGFKQGSYVAKSSNHFVNRFKGIRLEAEKEVRKRMSNLSWRYSGLNESSSNGDLLGLDRRA